MTAAQTKTTRPRSSSAARAPSPPKFVDRPLAYANAVVDGRVVAGPHVRNACRRHLDDLANGSGRGLRWDAAKAQWAIDFFEQVLRLAGGGFEGKPFNLHPSQDFIIGSLFGWKRADGTRRFRRAYIEKGKGNGKSPLAAGVGMLMLTADREMRAEVYAAASKKDQAFVTFRDAVAMQQQSPHLSKLLTRSGANPVWNLAYLATNSFFRPISADDGQSGPRPHCALVDEIHEVKDPTLLSLLERGFKSRTQPLLLMTTNSGSNKNSVCWEEHVHAIRVAAGSRTAENDPAYVGDVIDDSEFSYVCGLDKGDKPLKDKRCWIKANPLLGVTIKEDYLEGVVRQANQLPGKMNDILRLHFCEWTDSEQAWMSRETLETVLADFDPEVEHVGVEKSLGKELFLGLDLSATQDMTVVAYATKTGEVPREIEVEVNGAKVKRVAMKPTFDVWIDAWTPKATLSERAAQDKVHYDVWVDQKYLNTTEGSLVQYDAVAARVASVNSRSKIVLLAYDRYAFRSQFEPALDAAGVTVALVEHPQGGKRRASPSDDQVRYAKAAGLPAPEGLWMPGSVLALEEVILEGRVRIRNSPVVVLAFMSAAIERDTFNNRWFSKRNATNRIDALVAIAMAIGAATQAAPIKRGSVYEERGMLFI